MSPNIAEYQRLWELSAEGIFLIEGDCVIDINPAARTQFGADVLGASVERRTESHVHLKTRSGEAIIGRPVALGGGKLGVLVGMPDHVRNALINRGADLGVLMGGLVHELNNPLTFIMTNTQMAIELIQEVQEGRSHSLEEAEECLEDIRIGAERLRGLASWLRSLARIENQPSGPVRLPESFDTALRMIRSVMRTRARILPHPSPAPPIHSSPARLLPAPLP